MRSGDTCSTFPSVPFLTPSPRSFFRNMMRSPVAKSRAPRSADTRTSGPRSEEHTSELQSLMRISYAVFCLKQKKELHTAEHKVSKYHASIEPNAFRTNLTNSQK